MQTQSKAFACGKAVALGALYDAIEKLRWKLLSANSDTGVLVTEERKTGTLYLIRILPEQGGHVEVTMELASGTLNNRDSPEENARSLIAVLTHIIEAALKQKNEKEI